MQILLVAAIAASITTSAFAQTQPTRPTAYATAPTMPSAFATAPLNPCNPSFGRNQFWSSDFTTHQRWAYSNPNSSCYSGTSYPSYSAVMPLESPKTTNSKAASEGANSLDEDQAKLRIEAKGYSNISRLEKDGRGIWRGKASLKDGRSVYVILDLEGNIYSELDRTVISVRRPRFPLPPGGTPNYPRTDDH
jgi:hypothetical protein